MKLRDVDYLLALNRERNITRAAKRLGISQSTLSYFLANYEAQAGAVMFLRHANQLTPTELGRQHIEAAKQMANIKMHTYQAIRSLGRETDYTTLTIGVTPNRGLTIITELYPLLIEKFPNVRVKIVEGYTDFLERGLLSGKIDLFLSGMLDQVDERISCIRILNEEIVLAMHESFPLASRGQILPGHPYQVIKKEDLAETPLILLQEGTTVRRLADRYLAGATFKPLVVLETSNVKFACNLLSEGAGAGFIPLYHAQNTANLRYFSLSPVCHMDLGLLYMKNRELLPPEKYLVELVYLRDAGGNIETERLSEASQGD